MKINIRNYCPDDFNKIALLFFETVHAINAKDYTPPQLDAWAKDIHSLDRHQEDFIKQRTLVAEIDGKIAGFGSFDDDNACLDMLYVSKDFQQCGIATALCEELEKERDLITTYASITAKGFFIKRGYAVIKRQTVMRNGVYLTNFKMQKTVN